MKLKSLIATAALAALSGTALADINIGVSLGLTGPASALGLPMQAQLKNFPKEIGGQKINLIILDDATDPGKGANNARRFISEDKVDMILGSSTTTVSVAINEVTAESGTVQITLSPVGVPKDKEKWIFRLPQSNNIMAIPVVEHMKKTGVKTMGFMGYTDAYGEQWLDAVKPLAEQAGIKIVAVERFARSDTSVTPQALKISSANPDAVLLVASGAGAALPQIAMVDRGYKGKIYQTHAASSPAFLKPAGKAAEGAYVVSGPAPVAEQLPDSHPSKPVALAFAKQIAAVDPALKGNPFAAHAYDAQIVAEKVLPVALKKAKPGTPEFRAAIRDAIETMGRTPLSQGVMNWTATDHWGFTPETGVLTQVKDGTFQVVH